MIYNGTARWTARGEIGELISPVPEGFRDHLPGLSYLLLDEVRWVEVASSQRGEAGENLDGNLVALLFRLEACRGPKEAAALVEKLAAALDPAADASLRRAFTVWLRQVLLPVKLPGVDIAQIEELEELRPMLQERVLEWAEEARREGLQKGMQEGRQKGMQEGRQKGMQEGRQKGMQEGRQKGMQEGRQKGMQEGRQKGMQEGRQEGLQEGLQEGRREGEAAAVRRLLELRFGPLPEAAVRRIESAELSELRAWEERLLTAASLDDIF